MLFGVAISAGMLILAAAIALGHVEEKTSFGLTGVITILGKIALDWSQWAFLARREDPSKGENGSV